MADLNDFASAQNEDGLRRDRQMSEARETVEKLKQELQEVRAAAGAKGFSGRVDDI